MGQLEGGLGVLSKPIEVSPMARKGGGEVEVLILEDKEGGGVRRIGSGVEEEVIGGFASDGEAKRSGGKKSENEVRLRACEYD